MLKVSEHVINSQTRGQLPLREPKLELIRLIVLGIRKRVSKPLKLKRDQYR